MDKNDIDIPLREHAERIAKAADKQADQAFRDRQERDGAERKKLRDLIDRGRPGRDEQTRSQ